MPEPTFHNPSKEAERPIPPPRKSEIIPLRDEEIEFVGEGEPEELAAEELMDLREPGELQEPDVVDAFEIGGFKGLTVAATLEAKNERKGDPNNRNQDNIIADPKTGLLGVLDGLGGEGHGDAASRKAEEMIPKRFAEILDSVQKEDAQTIITRIVASQLQRISTENMERAAHAKKQLTDMVETAMAKDLAIGRKALALIEALKSATPDIEATKGKTTACVGVLHETPDGTRFAIVANVGDSGAFKRREDGEMVPLTHEDSLYEYLVAEGALTPALVETLKDAQDRKRMDPELSDQVPIPLSLAQFKKLGGDEADFKTMNGKLPLSYAKLKATLIASLGGRDFAPSLEIRRMRPGEELIFATDGVIDKFEHPVTDALETGEMTSAMSLGGRSMLDRLNVFRKISKERTTYKKDDDIAIVSARIPRMAETNQTAA